MDEALLAIERWEQHRGLHVVVHDLRLGLGLPSARGQHRQPCCQIVKRSVHGWRCLDLEITDLRDQWRAWPDGRWHRCHAGLLEAVVPIVWQEDLAGMLFAGQFRDQDGGADCRYRQPASPADALITRAALPEPPSHAAGAGLLEDLRQLAARLLLIAVQHGNGDRQPPSRRARIDLFLHDHADDPTLRIDDLAAYLGLSPSRTAHLLQELYGRSFVQVLTARRLRRACELLRIGDLPIGHIALAAGFGTLSHFHRVFKQHVGTTPRRYRSTAS